MPLEFANNLALIDNFPDLPAGDTSGGRNELLDIVVLLTFPDADNGVVGFPSIFRSLNELFNCGERPLVGGCDRTLVLRTGDACSPSFSRKPISRNRVIHSGSGPGPLGLGEGSDDGSVMLLRFWNF